MPKMLTYEERAKRLLEKIQTSDAFHAAVRKRCGTDGTKRKHRARLLVAEHRRKRAKKKAAKEAKRLHWHQRRFECAAARVDKAYGKRLKPYVMTFKTTEKNLRVILERLPGAVVEKLIEMQLLSQEQREPAITSARKALPA